MLEIGAYTNLPMKSLLGCSGIFPKAETQSSEFHLVSAIFFQKEV
jgi:hypothetical protein